MDRKNFPQRFHRALALLFTALLCGCEDTGRTAREVAGDMSRMFSEQRIAEAYQQTASAFRFTRSGSHASLLTLRRCPRCLRRQLHL